MGAHLNAYTSREQTVYYAKAFSKDLPQGRVQYSSVEELLSWTSMCFHHMVYTFTLLYSIIYMYIFIYMLCFHCILDILIILCLCLCLYLFYFSVIHVSSAAVLLLRQSETNIFQITKYK